MVTQRAYSCGLRDADYHRHQQLSVRLQAISGGLWKAGVSDVRQVVARAGGERQRGVGNLDDVRTTLGDHRSIVIESTFEARSADGLDVICIVGHCVGDFLVGSMNGLRGRSWGGVACRPFLSPPPPRLLLLLDVILGSLEPWLL